MDLFVQLFIGTVQALLLVLELCLLVRAFLSWLPIKDDNPIPLFIFMVTEPIVAPVRALFDRTGWFRNLPIDMSFFVAFLLLSIVSGALGVMV